MAKHLRRFRDSISYYGVRKPKRILELLSTLALSLVWVVTGVYAALGGFIRNTVTDY